MKKNKEIQQGFWPISRLFFWFWTQNINTPHETFYSSNNKLNKKVHVVYLYFEFQIKKIILYFVPVLEYNCWVFWRHWVKSWKFCEVSFLVTKLLWNGLPPSPNFRSTPPPPICLTRPFICKFFQSLPTYYSVFWNVHL